MNANAMNKDKKVGMGRISYEVKDVGLVLNGVSLKYSRHVLSGHCLGTVQDVCLSYSLEIINVQVVMKYEEIN